MRLLTCRLPVVALAGTLAGVATPAAGQPRVELLAHPYPYEASLTILSDLHATTPEAFEAVHALVNERAPIPVGSDVWHHLGLDRAFPPAERPEAISGLGLPFGDSFLFYDRRFGVFADYDKSAGRFVPHDPPLDERFRRWHAQGWLDALHTLGMGEVTREKAEAAVAYLAESFGPIAVFVNHDKDATPSGVGDACCSLLRQLGAYGRFLVLRLVALDRVPLVANFLPGWPVMREQLPLAALTLSAAAGLVALVWSRRRGSAAFTLVVAVLAFAATMWSSGASVDFYRGDNPGSRYYNLDLLRGLGIRYFWMVDTDRWTGVVTDDVVLPETEAANGRRTIFRVHPFGDGSSGLAFLRNGRGPEVLKRLDEAHLDSLLRRGGRSILYVHWLSDPPAYFDRAGLEALGRVAERAGAGRLWTAPASALLDQAYAAAYVRYSIRGDDETATIEIEGFEDPIDGLVAATPDRLRHLSFRCYGCRAVDLRVGGAPVDPARYRIDETGDDLVLTVGGGP